MMRVTAGREYPPHPRVGVGGVVVDGDLDLLVRRGQPPLKGRWSLPGGLVELGEGLAAAVKREIKEETGINAEPLEVVGVFERIQRRRAQPPRNGDVQYHYVLVDFACRVKRGRTRSAPQPATDVTEARWVARGDLGEYRLENTTRDLILTVFAMLGSR